MYNIDWLKKRFNDNDTSFLEEKHYFTTKSLLSSEIISPSQMQNICNFYDLNANDIANERNYFLSVFQSMIDFVSIEDIYSITQSL